MKRNARFFLPLLLGLSLLLLLDAGTSSPQVNPTSEGIQESEVRQFIENYTRRFSEMNLEAYMNLFLKEAVENRTLPYTDIREAYRKTVQSSHTLSMNVKLRVVRSDGETAFASGRYQVTQIMKMGRGRFFQGNIQWWLVRKDGVLKIREINYGIDP